MRVIRDAIILVVLVLLVVTVRITPRPEALAIVPEARAASTEPATESEVRPSTLPSSSALTVEELVEITLPALRSLEWSADGQPLPSFTEDAADAVRTWVRIERKRDRSEDVAKEPCPEDTPGPQQITSADAAC